MARRLAVVLLAVAQGSSTAGDPEQPNRHLNGAVRHQLAMATAMAAKEGLAAPRPNDTAGCVEAVRFYRRYGIESGSVDIVYDEGCPVGPCCFVDTPCRFCAAGCGGACPPVARSSEAAAADEL
ncbi:unnamed protein product [Prorocentrum cordatum]|uniref:Subtilisin n=1 Tax=Prorocentrum cordatum TaxID=2364126 RepID=A0ABN9WBX9_9DINO|nr:unnamed protein product [Polarella glacialis]